MNSGLVLFLSEIGGRMQLEKFIVVVTYGRSGSTLLQRVLQTIPGAVIRGENDNTLFYLYKAWKQVSEAKKTYAKLDHGPSNPWWGIGTVNTQLFRRKLARAFVDAILHPDIGASIVGFKEIRYHETGEEMIPYLNFIRDSFENVRFVFHTRKLDETVKSGWWASRDEEKVRLTLSKAETKFHEFALANPAISFEMNYRDLVEKAEGLWNLFKFLEVTPDKMAIDVVLQEKLTHARQPVDLGKAK